MSAPRATYLEDEHRFHWEDCDVEIVLERFREERGELRAQAQPRQASSGAFLPSEKLNLESARSIKTYANTLASRGLLESEEWVTLLSQACELATKRYREGAPALVLADVEYAAAPRYVLKPFVERSGTTILFGDGGVSKSLHALAMAISVASGWVVMPSSEVPSLQGPVLYLDWEADAETHAERLGAICAGMGMEVPRGIIYMRRDGSLHESVREIRRVIATEGVVLAVVDSVGAASAGDPEKAETVIRCMNAMRMLGVPVLAIHHVTKEQKDKSKPFGSVYAPNLARLTWRLDSADQAGSRTVRVRFTHFKGNNVSKEASRGHAVTFDSDEEGRLLTVEFGEASTYQLPAEHGRSAGGIKYAIAQALQSGALTIDEIAEETGIKANTVRQTLRRNKDGWFVQVAEGWGLIEHGDMSR